MKCVKFHADRPSRVGVQKGQENRCQIVVTCFYVTTWRARNTQISAPRYTDICISADICIHLFTCIVKQTKFIFSLFVSIKFPRKMFDKKKEINTPSSFSSLRSLTYSLHEMRGTGIKTSKPRGIKTIGWEDQPTKIEQVRKIKSKVRERGKVKEIVGSGRLQRKREWAERRERRGEWEIQGKGEGCRIKEREEERRKQQEGRSRERGKEQVGWLMLSFDIKVNCHLKFQISSFATAKIWRTEVQFSCSFL